MQITHSRKPRPAAKSAAKPSCATRIRQLPLPEPAAKIIQIALVVIVAIVVIWFLLGLSGTASMPRLR